MASKYVPTDGPGVAKPDPGFTHQSDQNGLGSAPAPDPTAAEDGDGDPRTKRQRSEEDVTDGR